MDNSLLAAKSLMPLCLGSALPLIGTFGWLPAKQVDFVCLRVDPLGKEVSAFQSTAGDDREMINGFHHAAIIVSNYEVSREFYTQALGFRIIAETHRAERDSWKLDLEIPGGGQLEIFSFPAPPERPSYPEACGLRHLAFRVDDLDETIEALAKKNICVEPVRVDPLTNARFTFLADPDGLPLELYENT